MQTDPVVTLHLRIKEARAAYFAADDSRDELELKRLGQHWSTLDHLQQDTVPTSNAGARRKLLNIAYLSDINPWPGTEAIERSARRLAENVGRGEITPLILRTMRALMPACQLYDANSCCYNTTAKELAHAIDWCARPRPI
jgi:hypothetical protein